jgi:hypothetical protein
VPEIIEKETVSEASLSEDHLLDVTKFSEKETVSEATLLEDSLAELSEISEKKPSHKSFLQQMLLYQKTKLG